MTKLIKFETKQQKEARLVAGMYDKGRLTQYELYSYCRDYYKRKQRGVFYAPDHVVDEILVDSFEILWCKIEYRSIYVEDNVLKGKNGLPLSGSLLTYFMSIAKLKYLEWVHEHPSYVDPDTEAGKEIRERGFDEGEYMDLLYDDSENVQLAIIADIIKHMSQRCYEILTKYYYEEKDLDKILSEIPSIKSKNALKTKKHKCMENLRVSARETYNRYLNR